MNIITIVIPAYNEEKRIRHTLITYAQFFDALEHKNLLKYELLVVLNGCTDNTRDTVREVQKMWPKTITLLEITHAGKGLAIQAGFAQALQGSADLIGFVDADMATQPRYFYELVTHCNDVDGVIGSRYMRGAHVTPSRPWYKRLGSIIFYESLVSMLFGLRYHDLQCGAKLFKRPVVEKILPHMTVKQWAFDVELLYLCNYYRFTIKEKPTTWHDQAGSKLHIFGGGVKMLWSVIVLRLQHSPLKRLMK